MCPYGDIGAVILGEQADGPSEAPRAEGNDPYAGDPGREEAPVQAAVVVPVGFEDGARGTMAEQQVAQ